MCWFQNRRNKGQGRAQKIIVSSQKPPLVSQFTSRNFLTPKGVFEISLQFSVYTLDPKSITHDKRYINDRCIILILQYPDPESRPSLFFLPPAPAYSLKLNRSSSLLPLYVQYEILPPMDNLSPTGHSCNPNCLQEVFPRHLPTYLSISAKYMLRERASLLDASNHRFL